MAANIDIKHYDQNGVIKSTFGGMLTSTAISDFSEAVDDRVDALIATDNTSMVKVYNDSSGTLTFYGASAIFQARLTPTSGTPFVTTDATAITTIYLTPNDGNLIAVYDGTRTRAYALTSDISIKLTDTQIGTLTSGAKTVIGLTDTSQLMVGMKATGTNVGAAAVISTIDSPTQVTLSVNSTGNGSSSVTFKVAASTLLDIFVYVSSGNLKLEMTAWTNTSTRATALVSQNGYLVKSSDVTRRFVGCVLTTATDGQTERSRGTNNAGSTTASNGGKCYIVNYYNTRSFGVTFFDTVSHSYTTAAFRQWLANANALCSWVSCLAEDDILLNLQGSMTVQNTQNAAVAATVNTTTITVSDPTVFFGAATGQNFRAGASKTYASALGYNYAAAIEYGQGNDSNRFITVSVKVLA